MLDYAPIISHLLMHVADPDRPTGELRPLLMEFDTPDACVQLATTTARATAAKSPYRPQATGPVPTAHLAALTLISLARKDPAHLPDEIRALTDGNNDRLGDITIALLSTYRQVCAAAATHTLATTPVPERPYTGPLTLQNGADVAQNPPSPQTGADGNA